MQNYSAVYLDQMEFMFYASARYFLIVLNTKGIQKLHSSLLTVFKISVTI